VARNIHTASARARKPAANMILIAFGANIASQAGNPAQTLHAALDALAQKDVNIALVSQFYHTPAWPDPADPPFVNAVCRAVTALPPAALLECLHAIENIFGRVRAAPRNAPRSLDLDLLDYNGLIQDGPPVLPHPRLSERAFVLVPLFDVAPDWRHPVSGRTAAELLAAIPLADRAAIRPIAS
jgi:2-amino-4-hydroxy-6-hydroxymethyldihydropteridine diphosphokinase